jgi:hypothetical protein
VTIAPLTPEDRNSDNIRLRREAYRKLREKLVQWNADHPDEDPWPVPGPMLIERYEATVVALEAQCGICGGPGPKEPGHPYCRECAQGLSSPYMDLERRALSDDETRALVEWAREAERHGGTTAWGPKFDAAMDVAKAVRDRQSAPCVGPIMPAEAVKNSHCPRLDTHGRRCIGCVAGTGCLEKK